ncbi:hypothetical protein IAU60_003343 [Kwoniella sp. DSM 27419]
MEVSNFFARLLQTPKASARVRTADDLDEFDAAWHGIKSCLEQPDERQIVRGIASTAVPGQLRQLVDALVYESNRTDEDTTGSCLEYFLKHDLLSQLERLCEPDRPHGVKAEVLRAINDLIVSLSERFLVHNAVHRPLRRLLRSCAGDEPEERVDGAARVVGAARMAQDRGRSADAQEDIEEDLVNLMCTLASRIVAYPPLLLIFFHDKGWLLPPHDQDATRPADLNRGFSPAPSGLTTASNPSSRNSKSTHHFEFLLFSYLLRYAHREGQIGDPARAGLLFLFDIAFLAAEGVEPTARENTMDPVQTARDALGEFILDGDFAEVMAAGLGATYSLLPSKLAVPSLGMLAQMDDDPQASASGGMHLGAGRGTPEVDEPVLSTDPETRQQLEVIIKLFGFLQDIIMRCGSLATLSSDDDDDDAELSHTALLGSAISTAILDAVETSFINNVFYPSLLESSSYDGSAVAVLTYLEAIVSNLDDGPLLLRLLLALMHSGSNDMSSALDPSRPVKRTRAMGSISSTELKAGYFADEGRFTLKDLILDNLNSSNGTASAAALRLVRCLLGDHCRHTVRSLLGTVKDPAATALARRAMRRDPALSHVGLTTPPAKLRNTRMEETELYGSLLGRIDPQQPPLELAAGYAIYLTDMQTALEADGCFRSHQVMSAIGTRHSLHQGLAHDHVEPLPHRLDPSDSLVGSLFDMLAGFLGNTPDENVALTGAIAAIALCPYRSLDGWLLYDVEATPGPLTRGDARGIGHGSDTDSESVSDTDISLEVEERYGVSDPFSAQSATSLPALYQILREVIDSISHFRSTIDSFDRLLVERRQGLLFADHLDEAMNALLEVDTSVAASVFGSPSTPNAPSKAKRPGLASSLRSFLTPKKRAAAPATPGSQDRSMLSPLPLGGLFGSPSSPAGSPSKPRAQIASSKDEEREGAPVAPATPVRTNGTGSKAVSPFRTHYDQTSVSLQVEVSGTPISAGPWSPASASGRAQTSDVARHTGRLDTPLHIHEATFSPSIADEAGPRRGQRHRQASGRDRELHEVDGKGATRQVSLSTILDNCVILEEFIKELVALIRARRALGVDQVEFL